MGRLALIACAAALAACAAPAPRAPVDPVVAQCEYEAKLATANIRSGLEAGWMQGDLVRSCLRAQGR